MEFAEWGREILSDDLAKYVRLAKKYTDHEVAISLYIHAAIREQYFNTRHACGGNLQLHDAVHSAMDSGQTTLNIWIQNCAGKI